MHLAAVAAEESGRNTMAVVVPFPVPKVANVVNRAAAARLFDHLTPSERLIWADQPDPWSIHQATEKLQTE